MREILVIAPVVVETVLPADTREPQQPGMLSAPPGGDGGLGLPPSIGIGGKQKPDNEFDEILPPLGGPPIAPPDVQPKGGAPCECECLCVYWWWWWDVPNETNGATTTVALDEGDGDTVTLVEPADFTPDGNLQQPVIEVGPPTLTGGGSFPGGGFNLPTGGQEFGGRDFIPTEFFADLPFNGIKHAVEAQRRIELALADPVQQPLTAEAAAPPEPKREEVANGVAAQPITLTPSPVVAPPDTRVPWLFVLKTAPPDAAEFDDALDPNLGSDPDAIRRPEGTAPLLHAPGPDLAYTMPSEATATEVVPARLRVASPPAFRGLKSTRVPSPAANWVSKATMNPASSRRMKLGEALAEPGQTAAQAEEQIQQELAELQSRVPNVPGDNTVSTPSRRAAAHDVLIAPSAGRTPRGTPAPQMELAHAGKRAFLAPTPHPSGHVTARAKLSPQESADVPTEAVNLAAVGASARAGALHLVQRSVTQRDRIDAADDLGTGGIGVVDPQALDAGSGSGMPIASPAGLAGFQSALGVGTFDFPIDPRAKSIQASVGPPAFLGGNSSLATEFAMGKSRVPEAVRRGGTPDGLQAKPENEDEREAEQPGEHAETPEAIRQPVGPDGSPLAGLGQGGDMRGKGGMTNIVKPFMTMYGSKQYVDALTEAEFGLNKSIAFLSFMSDLAKNLGDMDAFMAFKNAQWDAEDQLKGLSDKLKKELLRLAHLQQREAIKFSRMSVREKSTYMQEVNRQTSYVQRDAERAARKYDRDHPPKSYRERVSRAAQRAADVVQMRTAPLFAGGKTVSERTAQAAKDAADKYSSAKTNKERGDAKRAALKMAGVTIKHVEKTVKAAETQSKNAGKAIKSMNASVSKMSDSNPKKAAAKEAVAKAEAAKAKHDAATKAAKDANKEAKDAKKSGDPQKAAAAAEKAAKAEKEVGKTSKDLADAQKEAESKVKEAESEEKKKKDKEPEGGEPEDAPEEEEELSECEKKCRDSCPPGNCPPWKECIACWEKEQPTKGKGAPGGVELPGGGMLFLAQDGGQGGAPPPVQPADTKTENEKEIEKLKERLSSLRAQLLAEFTKLTQLNSAHDILIAGFEGFIEGLKGKKDDALVKGLFVAAEFMLAKLQKDPGRFFSGASEALAKGLDAYLSAEAAIKSVNPNLSAIYKSIGDGERSVGVAQQQMKAIISMLGAATVTLDTLAITRDLLATGGIDDRNRAKDILNSFLVVPWPASWAPGSISGLDFIVEKWDRLVSPPSDPRFTIEDDILALDLAVQRWTVGGLPAINKWYDETRWKISGAVQDVTTAIAIVTGAVAVTQILKAAIQKAAGMTIAELATSMLSTRGPALQLAGGGIVATGVALTDAEAMELGRQGVIALMAAISVTAARAGGKLTEAQMRKGLPRGTKEQVPVTPADVPGISKTRVLDFLIPRVAIKEIKDVAYQYLSSQLKDMVKIARAFKIELHLVVRMQIGEQAETILSGPLKEFIAQNKDVLKVVYKIVSNVPK